VSDAWDDEGFGGEDDWEDAEGVDADLDDEETQDTSLEEDDD
jgi:hypothetical protein